ncbi:MAG TPA: LysR family transcriptional regulator [Acidimicrobiales bacterium]|jgi:LysR family hydrogen peroxide-inducible transcriptional activator|nr:LysR family transcriptional regulator [Acidimicrobiales bacterium]
MDLRQLAALVAVADEGTFSAAADALHTVQSNVSTHVRRLERELGAQLVDRAGNRLTEEGEVVVARARRVQEELAAMVADVAALRDEVSGRSRLGIISSTARWLVPLLLTELDARHPKIDLVVVDATTTSLEPQVVAGTLDLAIVNLPCDDPDLAAELLFDEQFVVVTPTAHPLASRRSVTLTQLADVPLVLPPVGTAFRGDLDQAATQAGVQLLPKAEVDGVRLTASMVFQGFAPAILPATAVLSWQSNGEWKTMPLREMPPRQVGLVVRRRGLPSAPTRAVVEVVRDVVSREGHHQPGIRTR